MGSILARMKGRLNGRHHNGDHGGLSGLIDSELGLTPDQSPFSEAPSDASDGGFARRPVDLVQTLWRLGWSDGRAGQPLDEAEAMLLARADLEVTKQAQDARLEAEKESARAAQLANQISQLEEDLERSTSKFLSLDSERSSNLGEYSALTASIYIISAFFLFFADLPLSLQLVADGFGIPIIDQDTNLSVSSLFFDFRLVLRQFWEALALSIGIVALGIFMKLFIDEIVERWGHAWKTRRAFHVFSVILLGFLITTTVVLGLFRAEVQQRIYTVEDLPWARVTFILLTVLFPLVGGALFAAGFSKLQRYREWRRCEEETKQLRARIAEFESRRSHSSASASVLSSQAEEIESGRENYQRASVKLYRHGFRRGTLVPETIKWNASLYDRCAVILHRALARGARVSGISPVSRKGVN